MLRKLRPRSAYDVMAAIAFFIALAGGTAWAANTIGSSHVIDESLLSQDVKNGEVKTPDLGSNSVTSSRIATGNVFNSDLAADSVNGSKVIANSLTSGDLAPNSVGTSELQDAAVTPSKLGAGAPAGTLTGSITGVPGANAGDERQTVYGFTSGVAPAADNNSPIESVSPATDLKARDLAVRLTAGGF